MFLHNYERAEELIDRVLEINPTHAGAHPRKVLAADRPRAISKG